MGNPSETEYPKRRRHPCTENLRNDKRTTTRLCVSTRNRVTHAHNFREHVRAYTQPPRDRLCLYLVHARARSVNSNTHRSGPRWWTPTRTSYPLSAPRCSSSAALTKSPPTPFESSSHSTTTTSPTSRSYAAINQSINQIETELELELELKLELETETTARASRAEPSRVVARRCARVCVSVCVSASANTPLCVRMSSHYPRRRRRGVWACARAGRAPATRTTRVGRKLHLALGLSDARTDLCIHQGGCSVTI